MNDLSLRPVLESDEDFLLALYLSVAPPLPAPLLQIQHAAEIRSYLANFGANCHQIVCVDGQAAGRWWVYRSPLEVRLVDIRLLPDARGRGTGTALIRRLQAEAPPRPLRLSVAVDNPAALRLYERLGFTITGQSGMHIQMQWG